MIRLTKRCLDILSLLAAARWLTTTQLHRRFFAGATTDAARKRLRALEQEKYIFRYRENRMTESLITLGIEGKRVIEKQWEGNVTLQRRPPKQLQHLLGINDVRIAAELLPDLKYFFSFRELLGLDWRHRLVPDALFAVSDQTFALEFDRGEESLRFFLRTKIEVYRRGLPGVPIKGVLVVAHSQPRMRTLMKTIRPVSHPQFLFSTIDQVQRNGFEAFCGCFGELKPVVSNCRVDRTVLNL